MTPAARVTSDTRDLRRVGDRVEQLLTDVRAMVSPPAWQRIDELMRQLLDLYGTALGRVVAIVDPTALGSERPRAQLLQDDLLASLLLLHGVHPEGFGVRVGRALERVRPYLGSHGGGIELIDADAATGIVRLKMEGSCDGCPSSSITIKLAVESAIKENAPEVTSIEVAGATHDSHKANGSSPRHADEAAAARRNGTGVNWVALGETNVPQPGRLSACELDGMPIVLCRIDESLYAYRSACAGCGAAFAEAALDGAVLTCPTCGHRYDVRRAGRSLESGELHLQPLPLLREASVVRVAVGGAPA